jgi:hypothetical protein
VAHGDNAIRDRHRGFRAVLDSGEGFF